MERRSVLAMGTISDLASALASGGLTSRSLVDGCLARIEDTAGQGSRAFLSVYAAEARHRADAVDEARREGYPLPRYAGIPISIKDLFDEAGRVNAAGSTVLADSPPASEDAPVVARLRAAGFIVVGRTNMTEFAYSGLGLNPHFGTPLNPFERDVERIPGGSSAGAAVSVTDDMSVAALGTDTGGSCRIPAALCGIVGFKPTARRVPLQGAVPLSSSLDSIGPLAATVECCRILDGVLAGEPARPAPDEAMPVRGLRLAVPQSLVLADMDDVVSAAFERALTRLSTAGAIVEDLAFEELLRIPSINAKGGFAAVEAYAWHRRLMEDRGDAYDPRVRVRIEKGALQSGADYIDILHMRADLIAQANARMAPFDAVVTPTVPRIAPTFAEMEDDDAYGQVNLLMLRNPSVVNLIDGCAISIPCHRPGEAPVGLMVAAHGGADHRLLEIVSAVEPVVRAG